MTEEGATVEIVHAEKVTLTREQITGIVRETLREVHMQGGDTVHPCRFDEEEAKSLHRFVQSFDKEGWQRWTAILEFGGTLIQVRKAGLIALVGFVIAGFVAILVLGVKAWIAKP